ncbi:MAG: toll/interleukin-1 receptor domain-containing protein [Chloroflexi bacterium]|nr:toll/interleukin-1 receptor domain-containing protein [Chloroflexota bacterium]
MKVFISWSGNRSEKIAEAFRDWLPKVIQSLDPFMSAKDIEKGTRWAQNIAAHLEETKFGLICLTSDNLDAPWIMFEAGALSKIVEGTYVVPYLFQVSLSQLQGPLTQFQATTAEKGDTREMMAIMNKALGENALPGDRLEEAFEKWWPELEKALKEIPATIDDAQPIRADHDILEEILNLVRIQSRPSYSSAHEDAFSAFAEPRVTREGDGYRYTGYDGVSFFSKGILEPNAALQTIYDIRDFLDRPMATSTEQSSPSLDESDDASE